MRGPLLLALVIAGCSEYNINQGSGPNGNPFHEDDPGVGDTASWDRDCPRPNLPGYDAAIDESCVDPVKTGSFNPVVEWQKASFSTDPVSSQVMSTPVVGSVNDDNGDGRIDDNDVPDVIFVSFGSTTYTNGGVLRAISGNGGAELWSVVGSGIEGTGGPALGDLDGDGVVEIVALAPDGVRIFSHDGAVVGRSDTLFGCLFNTSDVPAIADLDKDGSPEIIAGRCILASDGRLLARGAYGMGGVDGANVGSAPFAADIDGDGTLEVVVGNALYRKDGSAIWANGMPDGYPAAADFDGDGKGEIVVSGQGKLRMQDTDGSVLWSFPIPGADATYYGGPPTIADFDGDGEPEIGVAAGSRYSVFEKNGTIRWQKVTDDSSSGNTGSSVFDFEGDGIAEVVYADQTTIWVFSGVDGSTRLASRDHSNGTWLEYPVIADIDADGSAEIVVANTPQYGSYTGLTVIGDRDSSWVAGRRIWNQHAYAITNVGDDGSIPRTPASNWPTYNNFRSEALTLKGADEPRPDAVLAPGDVCEIDCPDGLWTAWIHAGNQGVADLDGVTLQVWGATGSTRTLLRELPIGALPKGRFQDAVQLDLDADEVRPLERVEAVLVSETADCRLENNALVLDGPFCSQ